MYYLNAWSKVRDGPLPWFGPTGAFNFNSRTLTILNKNIRFNAIDAQTGTIKTNVKLPASDQQL